MKMQLKNSISQNKNENAIKKIRMKMQLNNFLNKVTININFPSLRVIELVLL